MQIRHARYCNCIDANLSVLDLDEAVLPKILGPLVLQLPVQALHRVLSVADKFHGMSADVFTSSVLVYAALIVIEVLHDLQAHEHWPIMNQIALYIIVIHGEL